MEPTLSASLESTCMMPPLPRPSPAVRTWSLRTRARRAKSFCAKRAGRRSAIGLGGLSRSITRIATGVILVFSCNYPLFFGGGVTSQNLFFKHSSHLQRVLIVHLGTLLLWRVLALAVMVVSEVGQSPRLESIESSSLTPTGNKVFE